MLECSTLSLRNLLEALSFVYGSLSSHQNVNWLRTQKFTLLGEICIAKLTLQAKPINTYLSVVYHVISGLNFSGTMCNSFKLIITQILTLTSLNWQLLRVKVAPEWIVQIEASTGRVALLSGIFCTRRNIKKSVPTTLDCITQSGFFKHGFIKWSAL